MIITSRDNSLLREARAVRDGKVRELVFVEGLRLSEEVLRSEETIEAVIYSEELSVKDRARPIIEELARVSRRVGVVSEKLLESISYTKTPQGIVVLATRPASGPERLEAMAGSNPLIVALHQINNPVNVGAVVRTAEAAGAHGVIATVNTSDPFSPKALRGAMGSAFRLPIWSGASYQEMIDWCRARHLTPVCTEVDATVSYLDYDWTRGTLVIMGPESTGLTEEEVDLVANSIMIPMSREVESLNVSVAAGILLFEAVRQRRLQE
jgi:RNA methyltransferase, TrmH family